MSDEVLLEVDEGVATITLNRPATLNIVSVAVRDALIEAVTAARDHPDVRAVVLAAAGRHFSAGADLSEFGSAESVFEARRIRWDRDPWGPLWSLPQPVVVALHGYSLAAGLEMALLCDIRLAAPDTVVGLPETRLGMLPAAGGTQSLTKAVRPSTALPVVLTADNLTATEALERGLVHRIVTDAEGVDAAARRLARRWAGLDPALLQAAKRALRAAAELPLDAGLRTETRLARLH
jgi:enoyl-CoA hydratase/carnithine racemase